IVSGRYVCEIDPDSGKELAQLPILREDGTRVAWSPRGDRIAASTRAHAAHVWNAATGEHLQTARHDGEVLDVDFSPDGASFVTASKDKTLVVWKTATGERSWVGRHESPVDTVRFARSHPLVASADGGGVVKLWDAQTGKEIKTVTVAPGVAIHSLSFSKDDRWIVAGGDTRGIYVLGTGTGSDVRRLETHSVGEIPGVACSPRDDDVVASITTDCALQLTRISDGYEIASAPLGEKGWAVAWLPDGNRIATSGESARWRLWNVTPDHRLVEVGSPEGRHIDAPLTVRFTSDGRRFVTAGRDGVAGLWERRASLPVSTFRKPPPWHCMGAEFMPGDRRILVGFVEGGLGGGLIGIWDPAGKKSPILETEIPKHGYVMDSARGGRVLFTADSPSTYAWDVSEDGPVFKTSIETAVGSLKAVACSRDGARVVMAGESLVLWTPGNAALERLAGRRAYSTAFLGEDGQRVLGAFEDGSVELHDLGAHSHVTLPRHAGDAFLVCGSPDGNLALTGGADGYVELWNTSRKAGRYDHPLDELRLGAAGDTPSCAEFTPDGRSVIIGTARGVLLEYEVRGVP
ncbi:MAG TPA: hypothetical protein VFF73_40595, partial [Planctomycetota bacterium]|nr:hypothetical protein [Planctomycetota bacterium]